MECQEWKPSKELLTKCKKAAMQYNTDHASSSSDAQLICICYLCILPKKMHILNRIEHVYENENRI